jgi:signal transduction histidine kinase
MILLYYNIVPLQLNNQTKMKLSKKFTSYNILKSIVFLFIVIGSSQYRANGQRGLATRASLQDVTTINNLLLSAQNKRFTDTAVALNEANQALSLAKNNKDNYWIYKCNQRIATIHFVNNQVQKAHSYFISSLEIVSTLHDSIKKNIYSEVASSYTNCGDYRNAYKYHFMNYELGIATNNIEIQQKSNLKLGMFYKQMNDFEKATTYLIKSLDLSLKMNNLNEIGNSYRQLASIYVRSKNFDLALQNSLKSVYYAEQIKDPVIPLYYVYLSHAMVLRESAHYEKSVSFVEKSLVLAQKVGDKVAELDAFLSLGNTYVKMNQLDNAEIYYDKCNVFASSMTDAGLMNLQNSIGKLYLLQNKLDNAIKLLIASGVLCSKYDEKQLLQNNYELLSDAYEKNGNTDLSLSYLRKSVKLQASIFTEENTKRVADAQFKYDLVKTEEHMKVIQIRQNYYIIISIGVVLLLLLGFSIYFSRSKYEKNKILTEKNKEIKDKNRQLEESNEILKQFAFASAHDLKEPLRSISSFINIIQKKYVKDLPVEANEYMSFVTTGVKRMESLLNALLEFSSVLTDDRINSKKNDVSAILKTVFYNHQNLINEKKAVINTPALFPTIFMGDAHLKLLFCNLVSNALKFSKTEAKIDIDYAITHDEIILSVKDEGIGLDKSYGDKIFKLFQRLDRVSNRESVGVGLTICKNIVDKYSGRIWFDSVVNEGTTFYIAFPKNIISDVPMVKEAPQYLAHFSADLSTKVYN